MIYLEKEFSGEEQQGQKSCLIPKIQLMIHKYNGIKVTLYLGLEVPYFSTLSLYF